MGYIVCHPYSDYSLNLIISRIRKVLNQKQKEIKKTLHHESVASFLHFILFFYEFDVMSDFSMSD